MCARWNCSLIPTKSNVLQNNHSTWGESNGMYNTHDGVYNYLTYKEIGKFEQSHIKRS